MQQREGGTTEGVCQPYCQGSQRQICRRRKIITLDTGEERLTYESYETRKMSGLQETGWLREIGDGTQKLFASGSLVHSQPTSAVTEHY